ncbi:hypothetical protein D1007_19852 [Hordeum vulgare]|nr:hypothetical protein D1007_19852 [Hordeum vulgare]
MAVMHGVPHILEEHLATVDTSRMYADTRLVALNDISWSFLEDTAGAYEEDYEVFSQCSRAYFSSRADRLVRGYAHPTHHYKEGTQDAEASPSSKFKEPTIIDSSDDEE